MVAICAKCEHCQMSEGDNGTNFNCGLPEYKRTNYVTGTYHYESCIITNPRGECTKFSPGTPKYEDLQYAGVILATLAAVAGILIIATLFGATF